MNSSKFPADSTRSDILLHPQKEQTLLLQNSSELETIILQAPICYDNNVQLSLSITELMMQSKSEDDDHSATPVLMPSSPNIQTFFPYK